MAESLYVCHFSNGHIKVGRSVDPVQRIAQHAERLSCVGITLVSHVHYECVGSSVNAESQLIERCAQYAKSRRKNEWFEGLDVSEVREWAASIAQAGDVAPQFDPCAPDFRAIVRGLMASGVRQVDIAAACKCDQSTISDLASGQVKDPRYSMGVVLLGLAASVKAGAQPQLTQAS